jgi:hypothetical protein
MIITDYLQKLINKRLSEKNIYNTNYVYSKQEMLENQVIDSKTTYESFKHLYEEGDVFLVRVFLIKSEDSKIY